MLPLWETVLYSTVSHKGSISFLSDRIIVLTDS